VLDNEIDNLTMLFPAPEQPKAAKPKPKPTEAAIQSNSQTGKGKQKASPAGQEDDDEDGDGNRPGPLTAECKQELSALHAQYLESIDQLAKKYGKQVQPLHKFLAISQKQGRATSAWNTYQAWLTAENGGGETRGDSKCLLGGLSYL
jgi:hypothetical protein